MAMMRGPGSAITVSTELRAITIKLDPFAAPSVELRGVPKTSNRRINLSTEVIITTAALGPKGQAFIQEMREQFGRPAAVSPAKKDPPS